MRPPKLNDDFEKEELQYDLSRSKNTINFLIGVIIAFIIATTALSIKIGSLNDKIGFLRTDYQILLQICNERE